MKQIVTLMVILFGVVISSCSNSGKTTSNKFIQALPSGKKIEDVIKGYFDKNDWHYRMYTDEDSIVTFVLKFSGDNETLNFRVNIIPQDEIYQIICQSETKLAPKDMQNGIIAMNKYNLRAQVVSGCISRKGDIIFWLGRNTDGNTFSEQAFAVDLDMVFKEADEETAQIYKQSLSNI